MFTYKQVFQAAGGVLALAWVTALVLYLLGLNRYARALVGGSILPIVILAFFFILYLVEKKIDKQG